MKSNPEGKARGVVVEAKLDSARGPIATVLIQSGTLKGGDRFFAGETKGKVRALFDHQGQRLSEAGPAFPVEVLGFDSVPRTGDILTALETGRKSTSASERRERLMAVRDEWHGDVAALQAQVRVGYAKELNVILKTDVEGSGEALRSALEDLSTDEVAVKIIRTSSGIVTETDVLLASASDAVILAFNTRDDAGARRLADLESVNIRHYDIIYGMLDFVSAAVSGMLEPVYKETVEARALVKEVFEVKGGNAAGHRRKRRQDEPQRSNPRLTEGQSSPRGQDQELAPLQGQRQGDRLGIRGRPRVGRVRQLRSRRRIGCLPQRAGSPHSQPILTPCPRSSPTIRRATGVPTMSRRTLRINELLREELSVLLQRNVRDPRLNRMLSITSVSLSNDHKQALVHVSTMGTDEEKSEVFQGLKAAGSYLRKSLGNRLSLRYIPRLAFQMDDSIERGARLNSILNNLDLPEEDSEAASEI